MLPRVLGQHAPAAGLDHAIKLRRVRQHAIELREHFVRRPEGNALHILLDQILVDVEGIETDERDEDGALLTPLQVVKLNQFTALAAATAFWDAVQRDVKAKNSKASRRR